MFGVVLLIPCDKAAACSPARSSISPRQSHTQDTIVERLREKEGNQPSLESQPPRLQQQCKHPRRQCSICHSAVFPAPGSPIVRDRDPVFPCIVRDWDPIFLCIVSGVRFDMGKNGAGWESMVPSAPPPFPPSSPHPPTPHPHGLSSSPLPPSHTLTPTPDPRSRGIVTMFNGVTKFLQPGWSYDEGGIYSSHKVRHRYNVRFA